MRRASRYKKLAFKALLALGLIAVIYIRQRIYLEYYTFMGYIERDAIIKQEARNFSGTSFVYKPLCNCRKEIIFLDKTSDKYTVSFNNRGVNTSFDEKIHQYEIPIEKFESMVFTCDMYNVLRRGPNSKILSYSLYGKNRFYYDLIFSLAELVKKHYPEWIVRIHYDESIDKSIVCEIECLKHKNNFNLFLDNVDFCNIEKLPQDTAKTWNAHYMHGMTWRWLPIGDGFVDFVGSRDTDAWIAQRELDSVNVWMNANTVFHVMRGEYKLHFTAASYIVKIINFLYYTKSIEIR